MTRDQWLSLGLEGTAYIVYDGELFKTIEAHGADVIGLRRRSKEVVKLATKNDYQEAEAVAKILRFMMPERY